MASQTVKNYEEKIKIARKDIETLISEKKSNAIDFLRFAYASQFSIAKGGAESTAKDHLKTIETIHDNHPTITYPDLYQLAGTVAVEKLGGPKIKFIPGRKDSQTPPDDSCLRDLTRLKDLKEFFDKVKITDPKHMLALYGGLKVLQAKAGDTGGDLTFDNKYFWDLHNKKDLSDSDKTLYKDEDFRSIVDRYANDKEVFFKDYVEAHKKLSEFGIEHDEHTPKKLIANTPTAVGVGVAVAAAVVIFSIFYLIHKRRTQHPSQQFP